MRETTALERSLIDETELRCRSIPWCGLLKSSRCRAGASRAPSAHIMAVMIGAKNALNLLAGPGSKSPEGTTLDQLSRCFRDISQTAGTLLPDHNITSAVCPPRYKIKAVDRLLTEPINRPLIALQA